MDALVRCLDLFCCAGGAAMGLHRAGFDMTGVDINPQPHYCGDEFYQADALEFLAAHWREYDAFHASPPCQGYSITKNIHTCRGKDYPKLIEPTRQILRAIGKPYVIENVVGAPLENSIMLCGLMFCLKVLRHRLFETNLPFFLSIPHPLHGGIQIGKDGFCCVIGHSAVKGNSNFQYPNSKAMWQAAMGIDWMTKYEMTQAIPPAYTEFVGKYLLAYLETI